MSALLFSLLYSQSSVWSQPLLPPRSMADAPGFQYLPSNDDFLDIIEHEDVDSTIKGASGTKDKTRKRAEEYYASSITIASSSTFSYNYAFGAGIAYESGGALFVSYSTLNGDNAKFDNNAAGVGGGLCSVASKVYLQNPTFEKNNAFRYGGAIFFQGVFTNEQGMPISDDHIYFQIGGSFKSNSAGELGGAIALSSVGDSSYFQGISFTLNQAGMSGGAFFSLNSETQFYTCNFKQNVVTNMKMEPKPQPYGIFGDSHFRARGGGAICFVSDTSAEGYNKPTGKLDRKMYSQECCFVEDCVYGGTSFGKGPGHEIMIDGYAVWTSFSDVIPGYPGERQKELVGFANKDTFNLPEGKRPNPRAQFFSLVKTATGTCFGNVATRTELLPKTYLTTRKPIDQKTSYVPSPSKMDLAASPITKLPYATTKSWKVTPPTADLSKFQKPDNLKSVQRTYQATFAPTLIPTPLSSPFSTPILSPFSSPFSSPILSPFSSPDETPFLSPAETPIPTLDETPIPTPDITPTFEMTLVPTISASRKPMVFPSIDHSRPTTLTTTFVVTESKVTSTLTQISTLTRVDGSETIIIVDSMVATDTFTEIKVPSNIIINTDAADSNEVNQENKSNNFILMIAAGAGGLLLIIIIVLIAFFMLRKGKEHSSTSCVEMAEETILNLPDEVSAPVTNDNPLWTTSVCGISDDPFRNDFEEDIITTDYFSKQNGPNLSF